VRECMPCGGGSLGGPGEHRRAVHGNCACMGPPPPHAFGSRDPRAAPTHALTPVCCQCRCSQHVVAMLKCVDKKQWAWHWSCMEQHAALQKCYLENQEPPGWASSKFWKSVTQGLESARAWWRPEATSPEAAAREPSAPPGRPTEEGPSLGGAGKAGR
jgi:hypothetical protein